MPQSFLISFDFTPLVKNLKSIINPEACFRDQTSKACAKMVQHTVCHIITMQTQNSQTIFMFIILHIFYLVNTKSRRTWLKLIFLSQCTHYLISFCAIRQRIIIGSNKNINEISIKSIYFIKQRFPRYLAVFLLHKYSFILQFSFTKHTHYSIIISATHLLFSCILSCFNILVTVCSYHIHLFLR